MKSAQDSTNVCRHEEMDRFGGSVEGNCKTNAGGASPVYLNIKQELKIGIRL